MKYFSSNNYCSFDGKRLDILKVVLSFFIVGIHTTPVGAFYRPIIRVAVPVFFIMTSYFFFLNQKKLDSLNEKRAYMWKYVRRFMKLYFFWFVVLLPITVICRKWYVDFGLGTFVRILQSFLFSSTFRASWFLMASLVNILFVWYVARRFSNIFLFILGFILYFICCLFSNYYYFIDKGLVIDIYHKYVSVFSSPFNSFPVALLFVVIGKYLAEHSVYIPNKQLIILFVLSIAFLYIEYYVIEIKMMELYPFPYQLFRNDDSFFFLIPSSFLLFVIVGQNYLKIDRETIILRNCSTIVYCCHCSIVSVVNHILGVIGLYSQPSMLFMIVLFLSFLVFMIIYKLSHIREFKFIKWAY